MRFVAACWLGGCGTLTDFTEDEEVDPADLDSQPGPGDDRDRDDEWDDGFETGALDEAWVVDGAVGWSVWSAASREGDYCAMSGAIYDAESSHLGLTIDFPDGGTVSFWHAGSTEATYDVLHFAIDGVDAGYWSGLWAWQEALYDVEPGVHNLRWSYVKDASRSGGQDGVLLDEVFIVGGRP